MFYTATHIPAARVLHISRTIDKQFLQSVCSAFRHDKAPCLYRISKSSLYWSGICYYNLNIKSSSRFEWSPATCVRSRNSLLTRNMLTLPWAALKILSWHSIYSPICRARVPTENCSCRDEWHNKWEKLGFFQVFFWHNAPFLCSEYKQFKTKTSYESHQNNSNKNELNCDKIKSIWRFSLNCPTAVQSSL